MKWCMQSELGHAVAVALAFGACAGMASSACAEEDPPLRWSGYVQVRETLRDGGGGLTASLNRARLTLNAALSPGWSAQVSAEYASSGSAGTGGFSLRDAYVRGEKNRWSVQAGQYKTPMTREYLISASAIETPDRAVVIDTLATKRDIGVQVAYALDTRLEVAAGVFNGEGQNVFANRDSAVLFVGRIVSSPVSGISLGASGASYEGDSTRVGLDVELKARGAWVRGEWLQQDADAGLGDQEGWYALAGYRVLPSWSVVARREDLLRPSLAEARSRYRATTIGVLWEPPGGRIRGLVDWIERSAGQAPDISHAWIAQLQGKF